jgi:hypothetical protein
MRPSKRIVAGAASLALVLGAGAGIADAAHKDGSGSGAGAGQGPGGPPGAQAIASYLGLTAAELGTQLQSGKTLAQVATAQGKSVSGLEDAIVADATTHLDAGVAAGKLTAAQEASMLAGLKTHVDDMVNSTGPPAGGHGPGGPGGGPGGGPFDPQAIADYLGLTQSALRTQLQAGKSLADVASAQGKTVAGLQAAIVAAATTKLDAAVSAGTITAAQESSRLADLKSHLDDIVNRTGPPAGGPGQGGPPPAGAGAAAFGLRR